ncbi:MAG TPA: outer membrane lipoprotein chaperone LolA [Thermoanaerobaculia bacterium]|nr:outer membrane lipoprotein chaperone LolA [Thermoanaerobaculia bacterium]
MRTSSLIAALLLSTALFAQKPIELDRAAAAMSGMEASFTHRFTAKGFKTSQVESGSVVFGPLPKMRWSYTSPEKKLFVFDGSQSWFYVPGDNQVTLGRVNDARKRELPFLLLGDPAARDKHFIVREKTSKGLVVTTLQPRAGGGAVRSVTVTINPSTHLIQRIEYSDAGGNRTSFDFSGYHRRAASAGTFRFDPPQGVQIVRAD